MTIAEHGRLLSPVRGTIPIKREPINYKKYKKVQKELILLASLILDGIRVIRMI
jgi:hypothetical protein